GLIAWLTEHQPTAVIDATHPFAAQMSRHASQACSRVGVPLLRLQRPGWTPREGDRWTRVASLAAAAEALPAWGRRPLLTTGQDLRPFAALTLPVVARMVSQPSGPAPADLTVILGRPPWSLDAERAVLAEHRIDVVVTKDSGGPTAAKLLAAREAGIPVIVVDRPPAEGSAVVASVDEAMAWLNRSGRRPPRAAAARPADGVRGGGPR
ncbi:MAG: cobalt-precorrin-6A reductase, partial [Frankiales bacterium]|nr:cobalt-precorrin-6A reductase [Frankiales bacterium]